MQLLPVEKRMRCLFFGQIIWKGNWWIYKGNDTREKTSIKFSRRKREAKDYNAMLLDLDMGMVARNVYVTLILSYLYI